MISGFYLILAGLIRNFAQNRRCNFSSKKWQLTMWTATDFDIVIKWYCNSQKQIRIGAYVEIRCPVCLLPTSMTTWIGFHVFLLTVSKTRWMDEASIVKICWTVTAASTADVILHLHFVKFGTSYVFRIGIYQYNFTSDFFNDFILVFTLKD